LMLRTCLVYASGDLEPSPARDMRALEAGMEHLQARVDLLNMALAASKGEMRALGEEARSMHLGLKQMLEDDPVRELAKTHAKYAFAVRPRLIDRLFHRSGK